MQRRTLVTATAFAATALAAIAAPAWAQSGEIRIAHVYSKTGALEAYGKQTQIGLMMGLEYATGGTMRVAGKKLVVIEKDDQGKPDLGKSLLASAYSDDKADIAVGPTSSGVALALLPVAEEYKKILLVEPAAADAITGDKWNKYIFRTGRNSSQDAISNAVAIDKAGVTIATLAQDYAFGRDGVKAFKGAIKNAKLAHEEYLPANTTDFTAGAKNVFVPLVARDGVGHSGLHQQNLFVFLGHGQHGKRNARRRGAHGDVCLVVRVGGGQQALAQVGLALVVPLDHHDFFAVDGHGAAGGVVQAHHQAGLRLLAIGFERAGLAVNVGYADFARLAEYGGRQCGCQGGQCDQGAALHGVVSLCFD